jgi:hypothetical protein
MPLRFGARGDFTFDATPTEAQVRAVVGRASRSYRIDGTGIYTATDLTDGTVRWPMIRAIEELGQAGMVLGRAPQWGEGSS